MKTELENNKIKDLYDESISSKYKDDYEFYRWFINQRLRTDYYMNYQAIVTHLTGIEYSRCFEFGPGPGTWTQVLFKKNPDASYLLVDISEAMKKQFHLSMRTELNVEYKVKDIKNFKLEDGSKFDMFFSSRALEYLDDKSEVMRGVFDIMENGSNGLIITKNSKFGLLRGLKDNRFQHSGQMSKEQLSEVLVEAGFENIKFYPVIIRVPLLDRISTVFSEKLFRKYHKTELKSGLIEKLTESFLVKFSK